MEKRKLPLIKPDLINQVTLKETETGLLIRYRYRPWLPWLFLILISSIAGLMYAAEIELFTLIVLVLFISFLLYCFKPKLFDECQVDMRPREIICKRRRPFPIVKVFRHYHNSNLRIEADIELGGSINGGPPAEFYMAVIADQYGHFYLFIKTMDKAKILTKFLRECNDWVLKSSEKDHS